MCMCMKHVACCINLGMFATQLIEPCETHNDRGIGRRRSHCARWAPGVMVIHPWWPVAHVLFSKENQITRVPGFD